MTPVTMRAAMALFWSDALLVLLHLMTSAAVFNLDKEGNVPTWWSSTKLLAVAGLALAVYGQEERSTPGLRLRWMWCGVAVLFLALSLDETASLHERSARALMQAGLGGNLRRTVLGGDADKDGFTWVILFGPLAVAVFTYLSAFAWGRRRELAGVLRLGSAGAACYTAALILEPMAVYFTPPMSEWTATEMERYQRYTLVEETLELFGTSFLVLLALSYYLKLRAVAAARRGPT